MAETLGAKKLPYVIIFSLIAAFIFFFSVAGQSNAQGQGPQFLLTWKALNSYVPASYNGKALPSHDSPVSVSLEIISGGKVANLKGVTINWYLDGGPLAGGVGLQHVVFNPDAAA